MSQEIIVEQDENTEETVEISSKGIISNYFDYNEINNIYVSTIDKETMFSRNRITGSGSSQMSARFPFTSAIVIGCGGIGSWVGRLLGNVEKIQNLFLIDPDVVEVSNLSRTPFKYTSIGESKCECLAKEINETNLFCKVFPIKEYFNENAMEVMLHGIFPHLMFNKDENVLVIDCRDDDFQDYDHLNILKAKPGINFEFVILRSAYDDTSVTIDLNPVGRNVWGGRGYSVQPSHILPSFMSALLILSAAFNYSIIKTEYPYMLKYAMTFNCLDMLPLLFFSARTMTVAGLGDTLFEQIVQRWKKGDFETKVELKERVLECIEN